MRYHEEPKTVTVPLSPVRIVVSEKFPVLSEYDMITLVHSIQSAVRMVADDILIFGRVTPSTITKLRQMHIIDEEQK